MLRTMLRDLRTRRRQLTLTVLAVTVGVAFVVAAWTAADATGRRLAGPEQRTDVHVLVEPIEHGWLTETDQAAIADLVATVTPVIRGYTAVAAEDGRFTSGWHERAGIGWTDSPALTVVSGRPPAGPGEVALSVDAAKRANLGVGGRAVLRLQGGRQHEAAVAGLFRFSTVGVDPVPVAAFDQATAQDLLGGRYHRFELLGGPGTDATRLAADVTRTLQTRQIRATARTAAAATEELRLLADRQAFKTRVGMLSVAGIAVLTSMFVIANTFTMLAAARTRQLALLRAVGATRRQVRRGALAEAVVVGLLGSLAGVLAGKIASNTMAWVSAAPGEPNPITVSPAAVLMGCAVGVVATVVAACAAAYRAAAVAPLAALRQQAAVTPRVPRWSAITGAMLCIAGVTTTAVVAGTSVSETAATVGLAGGLLAWAGALLVGPLLVGVLLRPVVRLATRLRRPEPRIAVRNLIRDPRRTAATAAAVAIGVGPICAFATFNETALAALTADLRATVPASTGVVQPLDLGGSVSPDIVATARAQPGIEGVAAVRTGYAFAVGTEADQPLKISALNPAGLGTILHPLMTTGTADIRTGVLVPQTDATDLKLRTGDILRMRIGEAPDAPSVELPVAGIYRDNEVLRGVIIADAVVGKVLPDRYTSVYLGSASEQDLAAVRAVLRDRPEAVVTDRAEFLDALTGSLYDTIEALRLLLGVAVIIGILSVGNTLALSVSERTHEIALIRAVGATPAVVRRTIRWESLLLAAYGATFGVLTGMAFGAIAQQLLLERAFWAVAVPEESIALIAAGGIAVGVLAAAWPARRALRHPLFPSSIVT